MPLSLKIKQVTGQETFPVQVEPSDTVAALKDAVAAHLGCEASGLRLIYRGSILKDASTLESYGLQDDHVVHMVKSKQPAAGGAARSPGAAAASPAGSGAAAASPAPAVDPLAQAMGGLGIGVGGGGSQADMMQQVLQSPMTQALLRNPELLRSMLQANPAVRQMVEANPEVGRMLSDPDTLRQMAQVMSNPALMREQVRTMDRAMSNIESMPGGFNALRQFHTAMQPLDEAGDQADAAAGAADNPFAALFAPGGSGGAAQQPGGAPNEEAAPNPWAAAGGGGAAPAGMPGLGGLAGFPGAVDPAQMSQLMESPEWQAIAQQMMADPGMRDMMQQQMAALLSSPEGAAQMQAMLEQSPLYQSQLAANPALAEQMRAMMSDPQRLRAMMDPRTQQAMTQMMQAMQELQTTGLLPDLPGGLAGGLPGAGAGGGAGTMPDLGALMGMLGGGGAAAAGLGGFGLPPPPANPEQMYATQLQQLQDMGFYDRESNIRALVAAGGNVNAAVERLLASM